MATSFCAASSPWARRMPFSPISASLILADMAAWVVSGLPPATIPCRNSGNRGCITGTMSEVMDSTSFVAASVFRYSSICTFTLPQISSAVSLSMSPPTISLKVAFSLSGMEVNMTMNSSVFFLSCSQGLRLSMSSKPVPARAASRADWTVSVTIWAMASPLIRSPSPMLSAISLIRSLTAFSRRSISQFSSLPPSSSLPDAVSSIRMLRSVMEPASTVDSPIYALSR